MRLWIREVLTVVGGQSEDSCLFSSARGVGGGGGGGGASGDAECSLTFCNTCVRVVSSITFASEDLACCC